ncbi:hypothetical protein PI87_23955 [Ralstonia sp. A12]|nr:hypothetical protein PI87_23955 [Ralstonia sp. A12]
MWNFVRDDSRSGCTLERLGCRVDQKEEDGAGSHGSRQTRQQCPLVGDWLGASLALDDFLGRIVVTLVGARVLDSQAVDDAPTRARMLLS